MAFIDTYNADIAYIEGLFNTAEKNLGITSPASNAAVNGAPPQNTAAVNPVINQPSTMPIDLSGSMPWIIVGVFAFVILRKKLK